MNEIKIDPIGLVVNNINDPQEMPPGGVDSVIAIEQRYADALLGIEMNSHIWILSWFHKASRQVLQTVPGRVNHDLPPYGVFALRSPVRPNPIGLSLTRLLGLEGYHLHVKGLDVINGTPVLDIKPYVENDCVFSPLTPYLKAADREKRYHFLARLARTHHQEECSHYFIAVRMALIAEEYLGQLNNPKVALQVQGSLCLADCLQGITRARFSNPERFNFALTSDCLQSIWKCDENEIIIKSRAMKWELQYQNASDQDLFDIRTL